MEAVLELVMSNQMTVRIVGPRFPILIKIPDSGGDY